MARPNFFRDMRTLDYYREKLDLSECGSKVFEDLTSYVEECPFSHSANAKFICENWKYDDIGLAELWAKRTGSQKSNVTFRAQISQLSSVLYGMLKDFSVEIFLSASEDLKKLRNIESTLELLYGFVGKSDDLFCAEVCSYVDDLNYEKTYTVEELKPLIEFLRPYMKHSIFSRLDDVSLDKLKYLLSVLNEPMSMATKKGVNSEKVKILEALDLASESIVSVAKEDSETPFNFIMPKTFLSLLLERVNLPITDEMRQAKAADPVKWEERKTSFADIFLKLRTFYMVPTLTKANPLMLQEVLNGDYEIRGRKGIPLYKEK